MATTRKIPADRGLTARMFLTGLLLVILFVGLGAVLAAIGLQIYWVIAIPAVLLFSQYWFSDRIALFGMKAHIVTPEQEPELHGIVDRLCALADMPKPRVAVAETDIPNAFATGRNPHNAVICATRGIMRRLDDAELEAVLAHEISHVAHRDVAIMTVASVLGVVAGMLTRVAIFAGMFGGGNRNNQNAALIEHDRSTCLSDRLRDQLPAHPGTLPVPRAACRPLGRHPDRQACTSRIGARESERRHEQDPDQRPTGRRALQRLLLRSGSGRRGEPFISLLDSPEPG